MYNQKNKLVLSAIFIGTLAITNQATSQTTNKTANNQKTNHQSKKQKQTQNHKKIVQISHSLKTKMSHCMVYSNTLNPIGMIQNGTMHRSSSKWYRNNKKFIGQNFVGPKTQNIVFNTYDNIKSFKVYVKDYYRHTCYNMSHYFSVYHHKFLVFSKPKKHNIIKLFENKNINFVFHVNTPNSTQNYNSHFHVEPSVYQAYNEYKNSKITYTSSNSQSNINFNKQQSGSSSSSGTSHSSGSSSGSTSGTTSANSNSQPQTAHQTTHQRQHRSAPNKKPSPKKYEKYQNQVNNMSSKGTSQSSSSGNYNPKQAPNNFKQALQMAKKSKNHSLNYYIQQMRDKKIQQSKQ